MRWVVLVLILLSMGSTGFLAFKWTTDFIKGKKDVEAAIRAAPIDSAKSAEVSKFVGAEFSKLLQPVLYLWAAIGLGLVAAFLVVMKHGVPAASLLLAAPIAPAIFMPGTLMFTSGFILAAILSLFVRRKVPAHR